MPKKDDLKNRLDELFSSPETSDFLRPKPQLTPAEKPPVQQDMVETVSVASTIEKVSSIFDSLTVGMCMTGLDGRLAWVNDAFGQMLGYSPAELVGTSFQSLTHPDDLKVGSDAMRAMLSGAANSANIAKRYIRKDGQIVWVELKITLTRDADGKPEYFTTVALDVTRQHETTSILERRTAQMASIMDATPDWIFVKDREHRFVMVNQAFADALGRKKDDFPNLNDLEMGFPAETVMGDPEKGIQGYWWDDERVLSTGEPQTIQGEQNVVNGELHFFDVYKTTMRSTSGDILGLVGYARDVTERERLLSDARQRAQSLRMFQYGLENSADAVFMTDRQGKITYVNPGFEKIYGFSKEEAIGQNPRIIKSGYIPLEGYQQFWNKLLAGDTVSGELVNKSKDGRILSIEGSNIPIRDEAGEITAFLAVHHDITEQKRAAEIVARRAAQLSTVAEISTTVASQLDPKILLQSVVDRTKEDFGFYHAHIYLVDKSKKFVDLEAGAGEIGQSMVSQGWRIPVDREQSLVAQAARQARPVVVNNVQADPGFMMNELLPDTQSEMAVPLLVGGEVLGVLDIQADSAGRFSDEDVSILTTLAAQVAVALQNARQYERIQAALADREQLLVEIQTRVENEQVLRSEMQAQVQELTALQALMSREAWSKYEAQLNLDRRGYLFDSSQTRPIDMLQTVAAGPNGGQHRDAIAGPNLGLPEAAFSTRLAVRGEAIGVLGIKRVPGRTLSKDEEEFLNAISDTVSQALERARLIEETQKAAVELQTVTEVGTAAATILDPTELLQTIVDLTKNSFGLYHAHVYLLDDQGRNLTLAAGAGEIGRAMVIEGWSLPLDEPSSIVCQSARERQPVVVGDVRSDPLYLQNPSLPYTLSELAIPLVVGSRLLGVFDVQSNVLNRFSEEDVRIYSTLAAQVAVALQNARLYSEQLTTLERLRDLDTMKSAFMANMSHELRTPLNSILGFTQVIVEGLDGPLTDLMESDLGLIEKNGQHLLNLINDILDMAKIEAGRMSLSMEPLNLYNMLEDVMMTNSLMAREKNLSIELEADRDENWTVMADHVRMRQIMINLLGNSLKFTESGKITLELEKMLAGQGSENEFVQVRFRDTGIGIPKVKLEEIFEAFSQVDNTTTRKAGGTGLGLPISRRLVEMHGGRLWAESDGIAGHGAVFILELPLSSIMYSE